MAKPARPSAAKKKAPRSRKAATTAAEDPTTARATKTASGTKAVALDERSAWSDDEPLPHDTVRVRLRRGTPVALPAGAVDVLLDAGYPPAYEAEKFVGPAVSQLLASSALSSVRTLRAPWIDLPWPVLEDFTSSDTLSGLETLFLDLQLPGRALALVLASHALGSLRSLTLAVRYPSDIPRGSYALARPPAAASVPLDRMDGLPSLETLRLGRGIGSRGLGGEELAPILRSPLAQRVRHLRVVESRDLPVLREVALPNLRTLELVVSVSPVVEAAALGALAANRSLAQLEHVDLGDTNLDTAAIAGLVPPTAFPSLRTLDLRSRFRMQRHDLRIQYFKQPVRNFEPDVVARLRARFGDGLILDAPA